MYMNLNRELFNVNMEIIYHPSEYNNWDFTIRFYKKRTVAKFFIYKSEAGDYINIGCLSHSKRYLPVALEYLINRHPAASFDVD